MSVMCVGGSWVLRQLGEKQHLEAELTRAGFMHKRAAEDLPESAPHRQTDR